MAKKVPGTGGFFVMKDLVDEVNLRGRIGSEKDEKKKKETEGGKMD